MWERPVLAGFVQVLPGFVATVTCSPIKTNDPDGEEKWKGAGVSSHPPPTGNRREIETDAWGWHSALMGRQTVVMLDWFG